MKVSTGFWESLTQPQAVLLAGLIGAFGALVAGLAANALAQLLVFRGQDRRRWEEARRTTYAKMQRAVMAAWDAYDEDGEEWDDDETTALARRDVLDAYVEASLLVRRRRTDKALDDLYDASSYLLVSSGQVVGGSRATPAREKPGLSPCRAERTRDASIAEGKLRGLCGCSHRGYARQLDASEPSRRV